MIARLPAASLASAAASRGPDRSHKGAFSMLKRALYLCLVTSATLMLLACGGKKDEDALMEDEGTSKPAASAGTAAAPAAI